jgi:2-dehydro-3-deoxygluconokinase
MKILDLKTRESCKYDLVALGEIMLRFDPGESRVRNARKFTVWEGGGEYNVARALRKCFRMSTAAVTALAENDIGRLVEDFIMQGGVDVSLIKWVPYDGIGRSVRNGLNFTERGFGLRGALGISDRGNTAASKLEKGDIDWEKIFNKMGVRWFHTGGIYAALSETTPEVIEEAMIAAKNNGTIISYDLNYRPSLWQTIGGQKRAIEVNRSLVQYIDVILGNEEDFTSALGFEVENLDKNMSSLEVSNFKKMIEQVVNDFPNFKVVATTLRTVKTANINDWGAICWAAGDFYEARNFKNLEILDRVGGGDSFASGLIYGFMTNGDPFKAVNYGVAHGALAMTTPGDTSMASLAEVEKIMAGGSARVIR